MLVTTHVSVFCFLVKILSNFKYLKVSVARLPHSLLYTAFKPKRCIVGVVKLSQHLLLLFFQIAGVGKFWQLPQCIFRVFFFDVVQPTTDRTQVERVSGSKKNGHDLSLSYSLSRKKSRACITMEYSSGARKKCKRFEFDIIRFLCCSSLFCKQNWYF